MIATNTGGLKRYIDSPLCVKGRKVFAGEIGAMQDMAAAQKILWDGICLQSHQGSIRVLLSDMVQHDDESALVEKFDGLNAWLAESDVEVMEFDALVVENYRLEQTMAKLASAMGAASGQGGVSVTNVTQTKAVKLRNSGAIQVGVSFELSDGQAVTAIFNHADSETQKLGLKDTLFSWKWKLNSRDISAAVQPNNFENVKLDILAGRIMKLVNANSARFQRSQAKKLENEQALADGNARIAEKKATIESLKSEIESLHIQADEKAKADQAAIETKVEDQPQEPGQHYSEKIIGDGDGEPIVLTGKELGDFPDTAEGKKQLRAAAKAAFEKLLGDWVDCPALGGQVEIRKSGIKKTMSLSGDPKKLKGIARIAEIIKNGSLITGIAPRDAELEKNVKAYHYLKSAVVLDGESLNYRVVVKEDDKGQFHYDFSVLSSLQKDETPSFDGALSTTTASDRGVAENPLNLPVSCVANVDTSMQQDENLVNAFDAAGEKYVLNLFIQVKDEHGNWVDLDDEDDFNDESEAKSAEYMESEISKQEDGAAMSIEELTPLVNAGPSSSNEDADYLNSIINGFNFAAADLDELENKLEAISERLTPETEDLFEQAAEAFAQYAISLEV